MRIKKINNISSLGTLSNFKWDSSCKEFTKYNFFYGWNYAGKTTLSRLFRCLEKGKRHPDYPDLTFEIATNDNTLTHKQLGTPYPVRVYNEDFIEENFKWNDEKHKIEPVLILGEESIQAWEELNKKKEEEARQRKELEDDLTEQASKIRGHLNITNDKQFNRNKLKEHIEEILKKEEKNLAKFIIDDKKEKERLHRLLTEYPNRYDCIAKISLDGLESDLQILADKVKHLTAKQITAPQIIPRLKENPRISNWVKEGMELHRDKEICGFCGNPLPQDLYERLEKHFSKEFESLMDDIEKLRNRINDRKEHLRNKQLPDKARFYESLQDEYEQKREELERAIKTIVPSRLDALLEKLETKRENPFRSVVFETHEYSELENTLKELLSVINSFIEDHNKVVEKFTEKKGDAKEKLKNHYVVIAIETIKYRERAKAIRKLEEEIKKLEPQMTQHNEGVARINEQLKAFFGDDSIQLESLDDGGYRVFRNGKVAKNLSAGERNIISLAYFFAKLEENTFTLQNAVAFIDDPVSSLDHNHIHQVYGFLSAKAENIGQLFVTTHNFDFFNLLKDVPKQLKDGSCNYYLIQKVKRGSQFCSDIRPLPKVLREFKSEYNYLFSILYEFNSLEDKDKSQFELLYLVPNIARRFLEAYLYMRYPDGRHFKEKCEKFFNKVGFNPSQKQSALKLINEHSHEQNPEHALRFPDIQEIMNTVAAILGKLEQHDGEHYEALRQSLPKELQAKQNSSSD